MTTTADAPPLDVNQAFKAEREKMIADLVSGKRAAQEAAEKLRVKTQARIDNGTLVPLGGNAYRVNDPGSYDNGEVWTLRTPKGLDEPLILPVSGLDETTGEAALYARTPAWHGLGNIVPAGVSDLAEVLRLGRIDFEVVKVAAQYRRPTYIDRDGHKVPGGTIATVPGGFVNVRTDTSAALGMVGKIYQPIQTYDAGVFLQDLVNDHGVIFESAGATEEGRHVFIGMKLPDDVVLDLGNGQTATIRPFIFWRNSFDGWSSASIIVTPWNIVCGNTERFAVRDALMTWKTRHTKNAMSEENVVEARRTLGLSLKYFDNFKAEEEALARTELAVADFEKLVDHIYPVDKDAKPQTVRAADERRGLLTAMYVNEADELGWSAYTGERVFTNYFDHWAGRRGDPMAAARATALVAGADDDKKTKVHQRLMLRVK